MEKVRISGIGLISRAGISPEQFWEALVRGNLQETASPLTKFQPDFPSSKLRRINRYCKMALYAAQNASREGGIPENGDPYAVGTIFTTGYGAMEAQLKFCREVAKGDPDFCSPTVFTGTVPNSCVGIVCMFLQYKGVSTMLSGGNHLEYSKLLLENGQASCILAGAVEEYSADLFKDLEQMADTVPASLAEACVVLCLKPGFEEGYCSLEKTGSIGLPAAPLFMEAHDEAASTAVQELLQEYRECCPGVIFASDCRGVFAEEEKKIIRKLFPDIPVAGGVKAIAGETLGCSFSVNLAAAALCLKKGYIPETLLSEKDGDREADRILVCGWDMAGNYLCALLTR